MALAHSQPATVFQDALALTVFDTAHSEQEERWFTLSFDASGVLLGVAHPFQATSPTQITVRLISARPATRRERQFYESEPR